jgi:hypothetical protein
VTIKLFNSYWTNAQFSAKIKGKGGFTSLPYFNFSSSIAYGRPEGSVSVSLTIEKPLLI